MEAISYTNSLNVIKKMSFDENQQWLDNVISLKKQSTLFYFLHIQSFIEKYGSNLGIKKIFYLEKLYYICLDMRSIEYAENILSFFVSELGYNDTKVLKMKADLLQISDLTSSLKIYKKLIKENQNDRVALKQYISLLKMSVTSNQEDLNSLIRNYYNEYLEVFPDDAEVWGDLSEIYISSLNYNKAIFCLEEIILHYPNDYLVYIKIADIHCSFNNTESAQQALKYYSQSILIKPTPRAFWGIIYVANLFDKYKKSFDENLVKLLNIAFDNLKTSYSKNLLELIFPKSFSIK